MSPPPFPIVIMRLKKRSEFLYVRAGAKAGRGVVLIEARRNGRGAAIGVGFTATKKIGGAVVRNRARRRLKEAARASLPSCGVRGVDYVFVARSGAAETPWARLLDDVQNALLRLRADLDPDKTPTGGAAAKRRGGMRPKPFEPARRAGEGDKP